MSSFMYDKNHGLLYQGHYLSVVASTIHAKKIVPGAPYGVPDTLCLVPYTLYLVPLCP